MMFDFIVNAYRKNKMPHAFLLIGKAQAEKEALIEKIVSLLLPTQGLRPDLCVFGAEGESILVDELREIHTFLEKTAHQNGYKVIVIHQIDKLSIYTANALLKSLEEPPAQTVFLLTAENKQKILPTLRSRCVSIHLQGTHIALSHAAQDTKAVLFWGQDSLFNQEAILDKITAETRETLYLFYSWVAEYCRYGSTRNPGYLSVIDEQPKMEALLKILPVEKAMGFLETLREAIASLDVTGLNKGLLWGALIIQWQQLKKGKA